MKKFMMMATAAVMMMMMSGNAMAAESAKSAPETYEAKSIIADNNANAVRVMLHMNGDVTNRFDYTIDADGNVISKTMYRFDSNTYKWLPVMKYTAVYGEESNTLIFAAYNKEDGTFTNYKESNTYSKDDCPVLIALPECMNY